MHWGRVSVASLTRRVLARSGTPALPGPPRSSTTWENGVLEKEQDWRRMTESVALFCGHWGWVAVWTASHTFPCLPLLPHPPTPRD